MQLPERILILAPHPDDEVLMSAGLIRRAIIEKSHISVVIVTNGDYLCADRSKGSRRLSESLDALEFLGVPQEDVYFMGYPDTGFEKEVSFLTKLYEAEDSLQIFPGGCGHETYGIIGGKRDFASEHRGKASLYNKAGFLADLRKIIEMTKPRLVITSSKADAHGDHSAMFQFTCDVLREIKTKGNEPPRLWESLIHSPEGDDSWPLPDRPYEDFSMPSRLEPFGLDWKARIRLPLPKEMLAKPYEKHMKYMAILKHRSALKFEEEPDVVKYLLSFTKREEVFWEVVI
jgi:LmbE family N-acetylglucosaminyl deacetylase